MECQTCQKEVDKLKSRISELEQLVNTQNGWIAILRLDIKDLLSAETEEDKQAATNRLLSVLKTYAGENHV